MKTEPLEYKPVQGKTYSLFGNSLDTSKYYSKINEILNTFLNFFSSQEELLLLLIKLRKNKRFYQKWIEDNGILFHSFDELSVYTNNIQKHLDELPRFHLLKSTLRTKEHQYYLSMIEVELLNRINKNKFINAKYRIALLPHCLKDFKNGCKSEKGDFDYICKNCSKECFINMISRFLRKNNIIPIIWMSANIKRLLINLHSRYHNIGVLGIACIPELIAGMDLVQNRNIPVIGVPLNGNRCIRWMGDFFENSIDIKYLSGLIQ
jgi:hypothetical protein